MAPWLWLMCVHAQWLIGKRLALTGQVDIKAGQQAVVMGTQCSQHSLGGCGQRRRGEQCVLDQGLHGGHWA